MISADSWIELVRKKKGPMYIAIVDALAEAIESGLLVETDRIAPQRELAKLLGVTPGTTARAYSIATERGLIEGEAGRGTFVSKGASAPTLPHNPDYIDELSGDDGLTRNHVMRNSHLIDLALPNVRPQHLTETISRAIVTQMSRLNTSDLGRYMPYARQPRAAYREIGKRWLQFSGVEASPNDIVITGGANSALQVLLLSNSLIELPILTQTLTYPGLLWMARTAKRKMVPVEMDDQGISAADLERACRRDLGKILYLQPNLQNPTNTVISEDRRREIVAIARKYDLIIIEDNAASAAPSADMTPIANLAPERTFFVSSTAKSLSPALSVGFISVPSGWANEINTSIRTSHLYASVLNLEILDAIVRQGAIDEIFESNRKLIQSRIEIVKKVLHDRKLRFHPEAYFAWLDLSSEWTSTGFASAARAQGIAVGSAFNFLLDGGSPPFEGVRISLTGTMVDETFVQALRNLQNLLTPTSMYDLAVQSDILP